MNEKFPLLTFVSFAMRIAGGLAALLGLYLVLFVGLARYQSLNNMDSFAGFMLTLFGLGAVASGEIIAVLFAIEANTRTAANK